MKLIVANWKMNPFTQKETIRLFSSLKKGLKNIKKTEVVICPPFVYLPMLLKSSGSIRRKIDFGAQNCFWEEKGAFTGEVSPKMLKDFGVKYVILGHSERRKIIGETDEVITKKILEALKFGLQPILCVGETKEERETGKTFKVLEKEIKQDLKKVPKTKIGRIILAYEPIWAIGSGNSCSVRNALNAILFLRKVISQTFNKKTGRTISILYGGSINSQNAADFLEEQWINGLLVGGASLDPKEFLRILKIAQHN